MNLRRRLEALESALLPRIEPFAGPAPVDFDGDEVGVEIDALGLGRTHVTP